MDSGNSGSLQSSSGGDEEYDSRASATFFTNSFPPSHAPPPQQPRQLFDPFSNYMQIHHNSPDPSPLNPFSNYIQSLRSDPIPAPHHDTIAPTASQAAARNPKKRSRASRRAPTTVLTTDTTNFRAMVQEFTGVPAQPFSTTSSYFPRSSFDLFGVRSAVHQPPPYLRRPFPQKATDLSPPPFLANSSTTTTSSTAALEGVAAASLSNNISSLSSTHVSNSPPTNLQQSSNLFNNISPNPLLMSSLLQSNPKFVFSSPSSVMASKPHEGSFEIPSNYMKVGGLDTYGLGHGNHVNDLPNLMSSNQIAAQNYHNHNTDSKNAEKWRTNIGLMMGNPNKTDYYSLSRNTMNNSASSANLHGGEKGSENIAATRGDQQGMVESWINCCSE